MGKKPAFPFAVTGLLLALSAVAANAATFYWNRNSVLTSSTDFSKAYNWTSNADATGTRPASSLDDDFTANTITAWTCQAATYGTVLGTCDATTNADQLTLIGRGADVWTTTNEYTAIYRSDITGDFDVSVKVVSNSGGSVGSKAGIMIADDFTTLGSGGFLTLGIRNSGTVTWERDEATTVGQLEASTTATGQSYPIYLRVVRSGTSLTGYYRTSLSSAWTQVGSASSPQNIHATNSQVGLWMTANTNSSTCTAVFDDFQAGTAMSATNNDLSFNGTGANADANATMTASQAAASIDFTGYTGTFSFASYTLTVNSGNATFVSGQTVTPATGTLAFTGNSGTQTFTPKSGATYPTITKAGASGTVAVATNALLAGAFTLTSGTWQWGSGFTHEVTSIATAAGTMDFGSSTVQVTTGSADLSGLTTVTAGTGTLAFTASSGTQVLTPKASQTHPIVTHTAAGGLSLSTNALSTYSFQQSAGMLNLNGVNLTTVVGSGGNDGSFTITNGGSTSFRNLGGRTITVGGTASLTGQSTNLLNLNGGTTWTLAVTGALTASYARIGYSNASSSTGATANSANGGGNSGWNFGADFSAWAYSTQININTTSTGANITSNLTNYPLLVRLDSNNFIFPQASPSGADIRFADPDGSQLDYEVARWDNTKKKAEIWVNVPQIDGNSNRDYVTLYWGNRSAVDLSLVGSAFSSSGWKAAYHLDGSPASSIEDAGFLGNAGTMQSGAATDTATSVAGMGFLLTPDTKYISTDTSFTNPTTFTAGIWFKSTSSSGGGLIGMSSNQTGLVGSRDRFLWMDNTGKVSFGLYPGSFKILTSTSAYNDGQWHYGVMRLSSSGQFLYVDGALVTSDATTTTGQSYTGWWRFGYTDAGSWSPTPTNRVLSATIDEPYVIHSELSADWIKFSYYNQKPASTLLSHANSALTNWGYSTKLYINTSSTGANLTSNVTSFPLLVRLTSGNFNFAQARNDGGDLRFTDSSGALLPYELERYDSTNRLADVWVQIPTVYANNNSQWFRMYWGMATATSLSSGSSVFLPSNGFSGVWHLGEDGSTTSGAYKDATSYGNNGTGTAMTNASDVTGNIGLGQTFNGTTTWIDVGGGSTGSSLHPTTAFTLEAWAKSTTKAASQKILCKAYTSNATPFIEYSLGLNGGGTAYNSGVVTSGASNYADGTTNYSTGTWYHVLSTYDGTNLKTYVNGIEEKRTAVTGSLNDYARALRIGTTEHNGSQTFNGVLDEVRVSGVARSSDWARLSYQNQKSGSSIVTVGSRSADFAKSVRFNFNTTSSGANIQSSDVTGVPILVRLTSSNFDFSSTRSDGADLQFIDKDGTYLYHELVGNWDKANQTANVWVKVPQVDRNSTTDHVTLYYGCSSCAASAYALRDSVWNGYAAVYHLNAPQDRGYDATGNNYHGTYANDQAFGTGATTPLAPSFNGTSDYITTTVSSNVATRTLEAWFYPRTSPDVANVVSIIDGDVAGQYGTGFGLDNGYVKVILDNQFWTTNQAVTLNTWQHVAIRYNATKAVLYYNGAPKDSVTYTQGSVTSTPYVIGKSVPNSVFFDGYVNDVKVMDAYSTTDFIKLAYENQKSGSTLFSSTTLNTSSFLNNRKYKFNSTSSGANISGDVYDFPVLLRITGTAICDAVQASAPDLRFLDADGVTWLDYSIERWNQTLDSAEVWVRVPKIDGNSTSDFITMYYGQASGTVPDGQCATCVFGTGGATRAVYHMNDNAASATVTDARGAYNGTLKRVGASRNTSLNASTGYIGASSLSFSGTDEFVDLASTSGDIAQNVEGVTLSAWVYPTTLGTQKRNVVFMSRNGSSTSSRAKLNVSTTNYMQGGGRSTDGESLVEQAATTNAMSTSTWYHLAAIIDYKQDSVRFFLNGTRLANAAAGGFTARFSPNTAGDIAAIGAAGDGTTEEFAGLIDEVQISAVALDTNWIKLAYQNQRRDLSPLFNPSPSSFQKTRKYTFNTTRTGANVSGNVTNFPLLVRVTDANGGMVDQVRNNAPDIRFLDGDGKTWLNYQVERWDKATDSGEVWVMVPQVDGNSDHDYITLYYQQVVGDTVLDGQCATCVFSTGNSFAAAYHLASGTTDATSNGNNGTETSVTDVGGYIGRGRSFNGTTSYTDLGNPASMDITGAITYEAWVRWTSSSGYRQILAHGAGVTPAYEDNFRVGFGGYQTGIYNGSASIEAVGSATGDSATWVQLTGLYDGTSWKMYKNGSLIATTASASGNQSVNRNWYMGCLGATPSRFFAGYMDEVRLSSVARDTNWIKLNYETQKRTGNTFWNSRSGPSNQVSLTATATAPGNISLSWNTPVSDSSNADSVALFVKYAAYPDSVGAASTTRVATLVKTDSAYTYPAYYPGTYYFALAVRNTGGAWSPFTSTSSDTANLGANAYYADTIYVDSAIGLAGNSCTQAQNPATPKATITNALTCGANASDSLVIRVMPGTYASDNAFAVTSSKPSVVTSFDSRTRAVLAGNGSVLENSLTWNYAVSLNTGMTLRNMDVKANAATNAHLGIYVNANADSVVIVGNRIYNSGSYYFDTSITVPSNNCEGALIADNVIVQPNKYGVRLANDDQTNVINNTFFGLGGTSKGIYMNTNAYSTGFFNLTNNIFYNWDYGIHTTDSDNEIGTVSNNLFFLVTSGREVVGETDASAIIKDPLFASTTLANPNAFKLLPGSPAIDAGTASLTSGAYAFARKPSYDYFGSARTVGTAPDIGAYEGTGYTPNPAGEFDTLITSSTSTTVTVKNSKWKLVFSSAQGGGINFFSDMADSATSLLAASSVLFDTKVGSYTASANTAFFPPVFIERTKTRAVVRQWITPSSSLNVKVYYTIYASGHIYVHSEVDNIASGSTALTSLDYTLKLGTATSAYGSGGTKNGFGYLTTATRDALLAVTQDLDGGAASAETWTLTAASGSPGTVVFATSGASASAKGFKRNQQFLLYIGDQSLDFQKAATLNADAYVPSVLSTSAGSLLLERSWQEGLNGHWSLDDGAGSSARDKAVFFQNNAAITGAGAKWVSGKVGGGLYLTATDVATATDNDALEANRGGTYMFWIKPDWSGSGSTAYIIAKGTSTSNGWFFRRSGSGVSFTMGAATVTSGTLTTGVWTHIAAVANGGNGLGLVDLYVNGVLVATSSTAATATANASNLVFGSSASSPDHFQGTLDDIRIFKNEIYLGQIQAVYARGFSSKSGHYELRADNNNRVVALLNGDAAATRVQPAFQIGNWYGTRTPKYVYLDGTRLKPNTDFVVDSVGTASFGACLVLQLNKTLTAADQALFVDDDDSTGFMGEAALMKTLTITATAGDKVAIQNFTGSTFGSATSRQWYLELDLNTVNMVPNRITDTGFGEFNVWRAAAVSPNLAVASASQLIGSSSKQGTGLSHMKLDATGGANETFTTGIGYSLPTTLTYTLVDSSSTRLSLVTTAITLSGQGTSTIYKRFTIYPTGRIFTSYSITAATVSFDLPRLDVTTLNDSGYPANAWSTATAATNGRSAIIGGDLSHHSLGTALLSVKNATSVYTTGATMISSAGNINTLNSSNDQYTQNFTLPTSAWTAANVPITLNFALDFSKDFTDSATADSLLRDVQNPAVITAISGTRTTTDALDFNADNFAEGDGAYTYAAAGTGIAHFRFVNSVTTFNPAFRINTWTFGTLPEVVILDNQTLTRGYHYNAYLNTAGSEVVLQFNKTLAPGTHVIYISHKTGLAVALRAFEAIGGEGVDTLKWTTESEFENLGYHLYRRPAPAQALQYAESREFERAAEAGVAIAQRDPAREWLAKRAEAASDGDASAPDTLAAWNLSALELAAMGYERISAKLVPGAKGGSSASTLDYRYIDRTASYGSAYEYLLEAVDFQGDKVQYGPRTAQPYNPLLTELYSNYPNPFNPITTLRFSLKEKTKVSLVIYDSRGRMVRTLLRPEKPMAAGKYRLIWDARDAGGFAAPSGQYFYRFTAGRYVKTRKMILVK